MRTMGARYDLVIGNARLRGDGGQVRQIGVRGGRIAAVTADPLAGEVELDAAGNLVTESFVDAHLHLCKVDTLAMAGEEALAAYTGGQMGDAASAIDLASAVKDRYDESWIEPNARRALLDGLRHGVTHVRAFADTDTRARLEGVRPLLRLRDELAGVLTVQVVAFPQDGVVRDPGAAGYVRAALEAGADLVGGIPWIEATETDMRAHIDEMLALAVEFDRDVAMLTDDVGDPSLRTTELLAAAAIEAGWAGRVSACHARAMALYSEGGFRRLVDVARAADMTFVTDPHTGPLHLRAVDLLDAGLVVALGQDDIADAYYPYGRHNLLEVAFVASHILGLRDAAGMETLLDMVTVHPARVLGLDGHRLGEGSTADLVVLDGQDAREVLARHAPPRFVVSGGRLVAETVSTTTYYGDGARNR
jgi:cytosine/creatinine deaminase